MTKALLPLLAALALGACADQPPAPSANLPPDAVVGAGDPLRSAVANTSVAFASPRKLAGRPADAAQAVAQMEYLAVAIPTDPRYPYISPTVGTQFEQARREWRAALGIPDATPPQPVIESLYAAARAVRSGQPDAAAAALPATVFPQGGQTAMLRLASLPDLPLTNQAAVTATDALRRTDGQPRGRF
ncbi:hypothetical protein [Paracraurococcus lichenis]|uniref:Uncharacterized protein n=1 Tax=Paracraurococcus lichenis TaxID=3064888 RepID=A0ABT9E872_9PROT|nr:hypothetical protein [Paracraurococcus sp. LOR1-02]MDO9712402.1 hypothetical protein [Paracraurococcus sp. LOR1-02]